MWTYFGSKANIINFYPPPKYEKIIEPFAGTARYSLKYFDRDVLLVDKYEVVVKIWQWLQRCSIGDIQKLPHHVGPGQSLDDFTFDCDEAKWLMGFLVGYGMERPRRTESVNRMNHRPNHINYSLNRISKSLFKIRHWKIMLGSYSDIENQEATWFIDPPYQYGGDSYVESNKKINYSDLGEWCAKRSGQILVCENIKADWMNFKLMRNNWGARGLQSEVLWSNHPTDYDFQQQCLPFQKGAVDVSHV